MDGQPLRPARQPKLPDLVRDSQLNVKFVPSASGPVTVHQRATRSDVRRRVLVEERWQRLKELGNGSYGHVWLEECVDGPMKGKLRAVKEMRKEPAYARELEALVKFSHQNYVHCFVECFGWYESSENICIAMEYLEHGDLQGHVGHRFKEPEVKEIAFQLVEGLTYMHRDGFTHRDLKPANILVYRPGPQWWVKIADFGITKRAEHDTTALRSLIGTPGFLAPEVLGLVDSEDTPPSDSFTYTKAVDMWALGAVLFLLMARVPAFESPRQLAHHVLRKREFPMQKLKVAGASDECRDFIFKLMMADPDGRLNVEHASAHSWICGLSQGELKGTIGPMAYDVAKMIKFSSLDLPSQVDSAAKWRTAGRELPKGSILKPVPLAKPKETAKESTASPEPSWQTAFKPSQPPQSLSTTTSAYSAQWSTVNLEPSQQPISKPSWSPDSQPTSTNKPEGHRKQNSSSSGASKNFFPKTSWPQNERISRVSAPNRETSQSSSPPTNPTPDSAFAPQLSPPDSLKSSINEIRERNEAINTWKKNITKPFPLQTNFSRLAWRDQRPKPSEQDEAAKPPRRGFALSPPVETPLEAWQGPVEGHPHDSPMGKWLGQG